MTETLPFETWDVFTDRRFAGNPLAVVFDADALDDDAMLAITREFDYSETAFVLHADGSEADCRIRIFTPGGELPFAGHPTVGSACALARRRGADASMRLDLAAGRFPVDVRRTDRGWHAEFENPNRPAVRSEGPAPADLERALGLPDGSIDDDAQRPRRAGAGVDFVYAATGPDALRGARLDAAAWDRLFVGDACGVLLYAAGDEATSAIWHARMFAPHIGVAEDPATGSAAAGLPAQLLAAGALADGGHDWIVEQGVEMGRPSRIRVRFDIVDGAIERLRVGGHAVRISAGTIVSGT